MSLNHLNYPLHFKFKITTLSSDFNITDDHGRHVAYVRQKMFKLKEDVMVFDDHQQKQAHYQIKATQWLDFNASYLMTDLIQNAKLGRMTRKGLRSFWRASYDIFDQNDQLLFMIQENNVLIRWLDSLFSEIPIIGFFSGYLFNPAYTVTGTDGKRHFKLQKRPSFWERKFQLKCYIDGDNNHESLVILALMMMTLLEKNRG